MAMCLQSSFSLLLMYHKISTLHSKSRKNNLPTISPSLSRPPYISPEYTEKEEQPQEREFLVILQTRRRVELPSRPAFRTRPRDFPRRGPPGFRGVAGNPTGSCYRSRLCSTLWRVAPAGGSIAPSSWSGPSRRSSHRLPPEKGPKKSTCVRTLCQEGRSRRSLEERMRWCKW